MQLSKSSISDVLAKVKHADAFFNKLGIDKADKSKILSEVLAEKHIDAKATIATLNLLNEVSEGDIHWLMEPTANLINHIQTRYHNHHRLQLPILISLAHDVEIKNQTNPYCPLGLADYLNELHRDLLIHMEKEEQTLFPFLTGEKNSYIFTQVSLAMHNHDHDVYALKKIDEITNNFFLPKNADDVWITLYDELAMFKSDLLEHIRLENNVLFEKCS